MSEKELFISALDHPAAERECFLIDNCPDAAMRQRLIKMLAIADEPGAATGDYQSEPSIPDEAPIDRVGTLIAGRFKLLELIGEGGMGTVYMAQQILPVKRTVAVKVVKPGMDSKQVLARFEAERQALAMMDHPNIARVFDAGLTADARPFFVMELVKGMPITKYCDERKLNPRERIELFVPVCQAIQHAHQKGIIHRDIKPANVIVGLYDDRPVPKVIDFGIAKSMGGALTDATLHTAFGAGVGTPQYMSPEQAGYNNLDVDTRSDIYALGILLYELLAGSPPLDLQRIKQAAHLEIFRLIREEEPVKPSTKLSTSALLPSIAACRRTEPGKLSALMKGELDWIVMKALDKERNRRYETANGFSADLQRYLSGEQVQAVPPSVGYRLRKFVKKNKGPAIAAALVFVALSVGVAGTSLMYLRSEREERKTAAALVEKSEALTEVGKQRDQARRNLLRSYLESIGFSNAETQFEESELLSIRKIANLENDDVRLVFLEIMLSEPEPAFRAAKRMDRIVQAVVGPRVSLRERALGLASAKQRDTKADPRIRATACLLATHLGSDDLPALPEMLELVLIKSAAAEVSVLSPNFFEASILRNLSAANQNQAALGLIPLLDKTTEQSQLRDVGNLLTLLAPHLDSAVSQRAWAALIAVLDKTNHEDRLGDAMAALAPRLDATVGLRSGETLIEFLGKTTNGYAWRAAANALAALAPRLDEAVSRRAGKALIAVLGNSTREGVSLAAGNALEALAPHLDASFFHSAGDAMIAILGKTTDGDALQAAGNALAVLAPRLDGAVSQRAGEALIAVLGKTPEWTVLQHTGNALAALAPYLDSAGSQRAGEALIAVLDKTDGGQVMQGAAKALAALAPRLDAAVSQRAGRALIAVLGKTYDSLALIKSGEALAALAPRRDAAVSQMAGEALIAIFGKENAGVVLFPMGIVLARLAPHLDAAVSQRAGEALIAVLGRTDGAEALSGVEIALAALAPRLNGAVSQRAWDGLIAVLGDKDKANFEYAYAFQGAGNALAALAPRLDAQVSQRAWEAAIAILGKTIDPYALGAVGEGLAALAPRLDALGRSRNTAIILSYLQKNASQGTFFGLAYSINKLWDNFNFDLRKQLALLVADVSLQAYLMDTGDISIFGVEAGRNYRNPSEMECLQFLQPPDLANLLKHPGCIGSLKRAVLGRLEEIAYPRSNATAAGALPGFPGLGLAVLSAGEVAEREVNRKFRTMWDAIAWIQKNHPEIDLNSPYQAPPPWKP